MRTEVGERLAVTCRTELPTVGNVERFALTFGDGYWHEPVDERRVSKHDAAKAPASRNYHPTEPPSGRRIEHHITGDGAVVRYAQRDRSNGHAANTEDVTLPESRNNWRLVSVHAAGYQKTYSMLSEARIAVVWTKCGVCGSQRNFPVGVWTDFGAVLGCYRCTKLSPDADARELHARKHTVDNLAEMHGLYKRVKVEQVETSRCGPPRIVIWAQCTGPSCGGHTAAFSATRWASNHQMACNACQSSGRMRLSPEQREAIAVKLLDGQSVRSLALEYGVHKSTINKIQDSARLAKACAAHEAFESAAAVF